MVMKRKKMAIAFISALIVVVAFNTAIVSAYLGNEKCQLFLSEIASYTYDDWGGWFPTEQYGNQVPGPTTHKEDVSTTFSVSEAVSYGRVNSLCSSVTTGAKGSFTAYGFSFGSNTSSTGSLSGTVSSSNGMTMLTSVTVPGEIYSIVCASPVMVDQCTPNDGFSDYAILVASRRDVMLQALSR